MNRNNLKVLLCLVVILVLVPMIRVLLHKQKIDQHPDALRIGVASGYAPWAVRDNQGELVGFDVDIAQEIAKRLNKQLELIDMSPEMLMASVRAQKLDCMVAPMAITPEREQAFNMVHYQGTATGKWPLMIKKGSPVRSLSDGLPDNGTLHIAALSGTKQSEYALSLSQITTRIYDSMANVLLAVRRGLVDGALLDPDLGKQLHENNPDMTVHLIDVPAAYQSRGNGIAINKNNTALADLIARVVETMKADGYIAQKESQWHIGRLS
jgi:ABC-type amino acid transport substrate-binding protein